MPKRSWRMRASGTLCHPGRFGGSVIIPSSKSIGPGAETPATCTSATATAASAAASRTASAMRPNTGSGPWPASVATRALPSTWPLASAMSTRIFVPPRSMPANSAGLLTPASPSGERPAALRGLRDRIEPLVARGGVQRVVLLRRAAPRPVLPHAALLHGAPAGAVAEGGDGAQRAAGERVARRRVEDEAGPARQALVRVLDGVREAAGAADERHRPVPEGDQLAEPARLVARRHEEHVAAGVDLLPEWRVELEPDLDTIRRARFQVLQLRVHRLVARAEHDEL